MSLHPQANSISAGQLLCGGLFSSDSLSNWCAAVALAHALQDNLTQKEQLLRVQLATSLGKPPVSLLQQCTNILSQVPLLTLMFERVFDLLDICSFFGAKEWLRKSHLNFIFLDLNFYSKGTFCLRISSICLPSVFLLFWMLPLEKTNTCYVSDVGVLVSPG